MFIRLLFSFIWCFATLSVADDLLNGLNGQPNGKNTLDVKLQSNGPAIPFYLQLLESIGDYDESLYLKASYALVKDEFEDDFGGDLVGNLKNDQRVHQLVHSNVELDIDTRSLIDLKAHGKYYLPRIQAHFTNYNHDIMVRYGSKLQKTCGIDKVGADTNQTFPWLLAGDRIYCTADDLFALQLSRKSDISDLVLPFDRIIGTSEKAPLLVLFGDLNHHGFRDMFDNLYQSAEAGKLRFIWRYVPYIQNSTELLPNYGTALTLKRSEYNSLDHDNEEQHSSQHSGDIHTFSDIFTEENIKQLGLQLTSLILNTRGSAKQKFQSLLSVIEQLPFHISELEAQTVDPSITENVLSNEKIGISQGTMGIYVNGAPVNRLELDIFKVIKKIEEEAQLIKDLMNLGFNLDQARTLLTKFALNRAIKLSEFHSGGDDNRYKVYENTFIPRAVTKKGGVVFINDILFDENYKAYSSSRSEVYSNDAILQRPGTLPPLKENIHELIFVLNLSDKEQLKVFFTFSKVILDRSIPQQIGVLPLGDSQHDKKIAEYFYFLYDTTDPKEALAFLYKVFTRESDNDLEELYNQIPVDDYVFDPAIYEETLKKFSINGPSVIFNGVINDMNSEWRAQMGRQIAKDVYILLKGVTQNEIGPSMKSYLFKDAKEERNLKIIPKDSNDMKYKWINKQLMSKSTSFRFDHGIVSKDDLEIWIVGDLSHGETLDSFINVIKFMELSSFDVQLRVLDTSQSKILNGLKSGLLDTKSHTDLINSLVKAKSKLKKRASEDSSMKQLLSENGLPPHHSFILVNSRYFRIDESLSLKELEQVGAFEYSQRISLIQDFMEKYPDIFDDLKLEEFYTSFSGLGFHDWKDLVVTLLTKSFHVDETLYVDDVGRFDFGSMNQANSFVIDNDPVSKPLIDLLVVIDPLSSEAPELLSMASSCIDLPFVRTRVLLQPKSEYTEISVARLFKGTYPSFPINFDQDGYLDSSLVASFKNLPPQDIFTLDISSPKRWHVASSVASKQFDPDNIKFSQYSNLSQQIVYELSGIIIEGFVRDVSNALPPLGLTLRCEHPQHSSSTTVMSNLGYFQLATKFGISELSVEESPLFKYALLSASTNPFDVDVTEKQKALVNVFTLDGLVLRPRVSNQGDSTTTTTTTSGISTVKQADINIFSVASGHLYERLTSIMMTSIRKTTKSTIKFWLLENYLSPKFKALLPQLSEQYEFEYQFVTYKWPMWLRQQHQRQRTIWGYKILFLDVLFPVDLDQVIFVDADQIARNDMKELVDIDMGDSPYGFVPMCDSRPEMEGFRFWKQGYWKEVLGDDLKYHISALFKVNLRRFRQIGAGDQLRSHYQKLSSDPNSLSNLDQDLPNNLQRKVPIFSLPSDFLWCETWCSDETMKSAKNIDLCNNPLSKENKLQTAKRLLPEWEVYDDEVSKLEEPIDITMPNIIEKIGLVYSGEEEDSNEDIDEIDDSDGIHGGIEHDEL